ncbi:MAG: DUF4912 domain-containing protein [Cyanobacteria bacterium P01_H01_bin.15]
MAKERPPLEEMTLRQLRRIASEYGVSRYSRMRKSQLLAEIKEIERSRTVGSQTNPIKIQEEQQVEAAKFDLGSENQVNPSLASVDDNLGDFPAGYGESRIVLMSRDPQWSYVYWDVPNDHKEQLRSQGGQQIALRLYDVTDIDLDNQSAHSVQEYYCDELAREWYIPIPVSDRMYVVDIGYRCEDGRWLVLARSAAVRIPPVYPSDWVEDVFVAVEWDKDLRGQTVYKLNPPSKSGKDSLAADAGPAQGATLYGELFEQAKAAEAQRMAGSLFGSLQHVPGSMAPEQSLSSYVFPSGMGMWSAPNVSGLNMSGVGMNMSGVGFASEQPVRPRKFWLVADAELIVYGATEPDATVTIGGRPIKLSPDGTFRFQMSFQDGLIDYPIMAVAADGEQNRAIHMKFNRETPSRQTNTKEEAVEEWFV